MVVVVLGSYKAEYFPFRESVTSEVKTGSPFLLVTELTEAVNGDVSTGWYRICSELYGLQSEYVFDALTDCNDFIEWENCNMSKGKENAQTEMKDKTLTCENCGKQFVYPATDQQFYEGRGIEEPKICVECRQGNKEDKSEIKGEGESGGVGGFNS